MHHQSNHFLKTVKTQIFRWLIETKYWMIKIHVKRGSKMFGFQVDKEGAKNRANQGVPKIAINHHKISP